MPISHSHLEEILEHVKSEGEPQLVMPGSDAVRDLAVPKSWHDLLQQPNARQLAAQKLWDPIAHKLPQTLDVISQSLQEIALLTTKKLPPSLVYIFKQGESVFAHRGFFPVEKLPLIAASLPSDLNTIYKIHNGWVDLFSGDMGLAPIDQWHIIPESPGARNGLLVIFEKDANALGFDLTESPPGCYIIWTSDEEIEKVDDFWFTVDRWIAAYLKNMDRVAV